MSSRELAITLGAMMADRYDSRRGFLKLGIALTAGPYLARAGAREGSARVVIVGGGFAGATCAKYLRRVAPQIAVTLVEPNPDYVTCPFSNAALGGLYEVDDLTWDIRVMTEKYGVELVVDRAEVVDADAAEVRLASGARLAYDRVVMAPGVDLIWNSPEGYTEDVAATLPHAWKAGAQTQLLRNQVQAMRAGGVVAISVPRAPFRCPPGPYERASLLAHSLHQSNPSAKILVLDANDKFSKQGLFKAAWGELYGDMIEHVPLSEDGEVLRVDAASRTLSTAFDDFTVDVANVIPAQRAGVVATASDLADASGWCPVHPATFESTRVPGVHVLGDAAIAGAMPKSASAANSQGKNCALALAAELAGRDTGGASFHNTCYSLVNPDYGISVSMIYRVEDGAIMGVKGAGGVSASDADASVREAEAEYARGWYQSVCTDAFA